MQDKETALWPGWDTIGVIGRGSFGTVYQIQRNIFGNVENAALKTITIPRSRSDIDELYSDGYSTENITKIYEDHMQNIVAEYSMMRKLSGGINIVSCDDVQFNRHEDGIGWDIFIKMELLTPLTAALPETIPEDMVIKLGIDMCRALEMCGRHNILHRDIKPQNIFVSENGDYKLGDFGIAKIMVDNSGGTRIGTPRYMAPEVFNAQPYGPSADLYSLGLVLYWMLNEKRMPFQPLPPVELQPGMDQSAGYRRLSGEPFPPPAHGSDALKRIVMKACAYHPAQRYASATEMMAELDALSRNPAAAVQHEDLDVHQTLQFTYANNPAGKAVSVRVGTETMRVWIPEQINNGQTFLYEGMGKKSAFSNKRGNLTLTIHLVPNTVPPQQPPRTQSQPQRQPQSQPQKKGFGAAQIVLIAAAALVFLIVAGTLIWTIFLRDNGTSSGDDITVQETGHQHEWMEANCSLPKTCSICYETEGMPLEHDWEAATYDTPQTCRICGATEGEPLRPEPRSLESFTISNAYGKIWTKGRKPYEGVCHDASDYPNCLSDWSIPGHSVGSMWDNHGNEHSFGIYVDGSERLNYYYEIQLEGKYSTFSGVCACPNRACAVSGVIYITSYTKYFEVYGDGKLLYTSPLMRNDYAPQAFSIDVTGVQVLKILYPATIGPNEIATIYDGMLE